MARLSHRDILSLNNAIGEIYAARDMGSFYRSIFSSVSKIIPSGRCSFNEVDVSVPAILSAVHASNDHHHIFRKLLPVFNKHAREHPFCSHFLSEDVIKTTDITTSDMFKGLALYNEYYRHLDVETQLVFSFDGVQDRRTLFALSRKGPDFTERDRMMLTLIRPHLINAMRNVTELGRFIDEIALLHKAADDDRRSVALLVWDGRVEWISRRARYHLAEYFGASLNDMDRLPAKLEEWVKREINSSELSVERGPMIVYSQKGPFTRPSIPSRQGRGSKSSLSPWGLMPEWVEGQGKRLAVSFVRGNGCFMLRMKEEASASLEATGLTPKETEVLQWASKGKTNLDIACILRVSERTVEKHLENIYKKLGVETRTAAAAVVMQK